MSAPIQRAFLLLGLFTLLQSASAQTGTAAERQAIETWRKERVERLIGPTGWVTLAGLYWLKDGDNSFGSAPHNALVLQHRAMPATLGSFRLQDGAVTFTSNAGHSVTHEQQPIRSVRMATDAASSPTVLEVGSLQFVAIERAGQFGVRVRDTEHPARKNFRGIDYFPIDTRWTVDARFVPYVPARRVPIVNILGMTEPMVSPGAVVFNKDGKEYRLETILEAPDDDELFIMFLDETSPRESYGAGRYVYIPLPKDNRTRIDFNRAYNPPCAFTDFATCPLPPMSNRLAVRVEAGEKKYVLDRK